MKVKAFIILLLSILWMDINAQHDIRITGTYNAQSVAYVLNDISKNYEIRFAFDSYALSRMEGSWTFKNESIDDVLSRIFNKSVFTFKWIDETVVIFHTLKIEEAESLSRDSAELSFLHGEIRDCNTRELLPFAVIAERHSYYSVNSDADGKFKLSKTLLKNDTLEIFLVGYEQRSIPISSIPEGVFFVILLNPSRNFLPDVMIIDDAVHSISSSGSPGIQAINPSVLLNTMGTGESDIFRSAQMLPGINATQESSNGLSIRGSNNDQTLVTLDGFNLYHQDHFFGAFSAVNTNAVKAMRIHKGVTDVRFGGRAGGVVELIGKEGSLRKPSAQIDLGPLSVGAMITAPTDTLGKSSILITARRAFTNAIYSPTFKTLFNTTYNAAVFSKNGNDIFKSSDPDFYFQDINFKFTYRPSKNDRINLCAYASTDNLLVQYADTSNAELENKVDVRYSDQSSKKNLGASIIWIHDWANNWRMESIVGLSRFTGDFFSADSITDFFGSDSVRFNTEITTLHDLDSRLQLSKELNNINLVFGLELNNIHSQIKQNEFGTTIIDSLQKGMVSSIYMSAESKSDQRLKIIPGVRINHYNQTKYIYFEPRVVLQFDWVDDRLMLKASAGRIHQYLQRVQTQSLYLNSPDFWQLAGNNGIDVLELNQVTAGVHFNKNDWNIDVESYLKISDGNVMNNTTYLNQKSIGRISGNGEVIGTDVLITKDFRRHHFIFGYTILKSKTNFPELNLSNVPEVFDQLHELKFNYQVSFRKWEASVYWVFGTGRPYTPFLGTYELPLPDGNSRRIPVYGIYNSARLPAYHRLDAAVARNFQWNKTKGSIQFSAFNCYNQINIRDIQYLTLRNSNLPNDYTIAQRSISMLGFLPSINLKLQF
jgi:ferric enterobactin receptor